jgi:cytochrome c peroxidase
MKRYSSVVIFLVGMVLFTTGTVLLAPEPVLTPMEELGKEIFFDKISSPDWMTCATCHDPDFGFTGPIPGINKSGAVYRGAVPQRFGNRKPPSSAYATFSPIFGYDTEEGLFIGGNFWDGRATGEHLGNPAADQALGPFLNPVEQNNASKSDVLAQIADSKYAHLWEIVWGEPLLYQLDSDVEKNYDRVGLAIAAYEASDEVNAFSSKYDYYLKGEADLTELEAWGLELFEGKAMCSACHPSEGQGALFTDFSFDNLGVPPNPDNPWYDMDEVYVDDGTPINPEGDAWVDYGLGGFLQNHPDDDWRDMAGENMGKHKVPTLRNVAKGPGGDDSKAFMHNGVFKSLAEVVHFYNTRDVEEWPEAEVADNVNTDELGDLGLSLAEEAAIVAFMETLSDGYVPEKDKVKSLMSEAYPNPFNPTTTLTYTLLDDAEVELSVFDLLGRRVQVLASGHHAAGTYSATFDAMSIPSGVYVYRLVAGTRAETGSLILVK